MGHNKIVKRKTAHSVDLPGSASPCKRTGLPMPGRARRLATRSGVMVVVAGVLILGGCAHFDPASEPSAETIPDEVKELSEEGAVTAPSALARALSALEQGRFEQARQILVRSVEGETESRVAANLLKQLDEPPASLLPGPYEEIELAPGESLSAIAHRELGDPLLFVALARLNAIEVPMRVAAGTVVRVPARAQSEESAGRVRQPPVEPGPHESLQSSLQSLQQSNPTQDDAQHLYREAIDLRLDGEVSAALEKARRALALWPDHAPAARLVGDLESELTEQMHVSALTAWRNRDVDQAIRQWESLLDLVPDFEPARVYLERARELRRRLEDG